MKNYIKKWAFTLPEVLLAVAIVGLISVLVIPAIVTKYQNRVFDQAFEREKQALHDILQQLYVTEGKMSFEDTMMFYHNPNNDTVSASIYATHSGAFLKKYMRVIKYCEYNAVRNCFSTDYYKTYDPEHKDKGYTSAQLAASYGGSCAMLKNGASICIGPQIKTKNSSKNIKVMMDINGPSGPNVWGRDIREFTFEDMRLSKNSISGSLSIYRYCDEHPNSLTCKPCVESDYAPTAERHNICCTYINPEHAGCCQTMDDFYMGSSCCTPVYANSEYYQRCYSVDMGTNLCNNIEKDFYPGSYCCTNLPGGMTPADLGTDAEARCHCDPETIYMAGDPCCVSPYVLCETSSGASGGGEGTGTGGSGTGDLTPPVFTVGVEEFWTLGDGDTLKSRITFIPSGTTDNGTSNAVILEYNTSGNVYSLDIADCNSKLKNISWTGTTTRVCIGSKNASVDYSGTSTVRIKVAPGSIQGEPSVAAPVKMNNVDFYDL